MEANINEENIFEDSDIVILNNNILSLDSNLLLDLSDKLNLKNYVDSQQKTKLINIQNIEDFELIKCNNISELENLKNNNKIITELLNDTINEFNLIKSDIEYLNKTYFDIINLFIDISKKTV
jgi:hypothetical protein